MSILRRTLTLLTLSIFVCTLALPITTMAVGVRPLRTELSIDPGTSKSATLKIINTEDFEMSLRPEVEVYIAHDEAGFPVLAEDLPVDDTRNIHDWISFDQEAVTLIPNSEKSVTYTVTVPEGAAPGGRYASVIYTPIVAPEEDVKVSTRVASLLLVTVTGEQIYDGDLQSFAIPEGKIYNDQPINLAVEFKNKGNVHVKPKGSIVLKGATGEQLTGVARYIDPKTGEEVLADTIPVNLNADNVLPGSSRVFPSLWSANIQTGEYTASLSVSYTDNQPAIEQETTFTVSEDLTLTDFEFVQKGQDSEFQVVLQNRGNIHERLAGKIEVFNAFQDLIRTIEIPEDVEYAIPGETTTIAFPFLQGEEIPDGKYKAKLAATYGLAAQEVSAETSFNAGGFNILAFLGSPAGLIAIGVLVIVAFFFGRRRNKTVTPPASE